MFKSYFITACRSLSRNRAFSSLNIVGLALGIAIALLIGLWVYDQASYDRFLPGYERAYQVNLNYTDNGVVHTQHEVPRPLEDALKIDVPGVAYASATYGPFSNTLTIGDKKLQPRNLVAGEDFLQIFRFPLREGDRNKALQEPNSIVLTASTAKALFGDADPMDKVVRIYDPVNFHNAHLKVTGVLVDLPSHSSFQFDFITPLRLLASDAWAKEAYSNWDHAFFHLYIGLQQQASEARVAAGSRILLKKYAGAIYQTTHQEPMMQPLKDWHLYGDFQNGRAVGGLIDYMRLFIFIGAAVLLIACINFMNLSTARSVKRAREVGVRKVVGSSRLSLILQFLTESLVLTAMAFVLSLIMVSAVLPAFNGLTHSNIAVPYANGWFWLVILGYLLLTALLAGSKPAFYLSSFQAVRVLKGTLQTGPSSKLSRKSLVVLQFTCSVGLIVSTTIIYQQIEYARNRPTGYDASRLLETPAGSGNYYALKQTVLNSGLVTGMTKSLSMVTENRARRNTISDFPGKLPNERMELSMNSISDPDYFTTLGMTLVAGRNFTGNPHADSSSVILNEAAARRMRLTAPVGQTISWMSPGSFMDRIKVIGVVKDALTDAPFAAPEPTFYLCEPGWTYAYTYRLAPGVNTAAALAGLKTIFEKYDPSIAFTYRFVDEDYGSKFEWQLLIGKLAAIFTALSVFICCLGLFGLAAYIAEQRTKEMGIRKVLGASVSQLLLLLVGDFVTLVFISCLIASPVAFYFLQHWLQQFYYRIRIGPGVFIDSAIIATAIAILTTSLQSAKAALASPVKSLKSE